jgi:excinuclease ABC subunit C
MVMAMSRSTDTSKTIQTSDQVEDSGAPQSGPEVIARYVKTLPSTPGVYRMLDKDGDVIYVGKARNLKSRVSNYARLVGQPNRTARMITETTTMEFLLVDTEAEALLLEANLIKRFRPRFNVLMRDDKSFPYILIAGDQEAPQILKHRGARNRKGHYFGPFASAGAVNRTINMMQRAFLLRSCSDSVYESRTRPCLLYQIKRCAAPCTGEIPLPEYQTLVDEAVQFLKGESQSVRQMYQRLMEESAENLEYENAAGYRNRLWALAHVTADQTINPEGIEEADVFGAYQDGGQTCIQVFFIRAGQNWGNRAYYPRADRSLAVEDVLESFIAQFYDDKPVPRLVLVSHTIASAALLAEALTTKAGHRVEVRTPQRGKKLGLVDHALSNAREALGRKLAETASQRALLSGIADRFGLEDVPRRIEVYDNSHISGTNAVGAMIVSGPEGLVKNAYRKFNMKSETLTPGDDYAMMQEVLTRRFRRLTQPDAKSPENDIGTGPKDQSQKKAEPKSTDTVPDRPDLVFIDGGAGHVSVARQVLADLGLSDIPVFGVAKGPDRDAGREHFHPATGAASFMLEPRDPVLYFVQRLRDEAHRFAIGSHRAKRSKTIGANPLDEIAGIGPARKRALMKHFGSAKAVSRAGLSDLSTVPGISAEIARKIYDFFHENSSKS